MPNMSYCRFENTFRALQDCHEHMFDPTDKMNEHEQAARLDMFTLIHKMSREIADTTLDIRLHGDPEMAEENA